MAAIRARLRQAWGEFVGPEATATNHLLTTATTAAGAILGPRLARRRGAGAGKTAAVALLAVDLAGGVYVNNTRACARWYERPGQGEVEHVRFAALHVHPAAVAWIDRHEVVHLPRSVYALAHYGYMMAATLVIRSAPQHRRPLGVALTIGGICLDRALGPSRHVPWFAGAYYPKLLMGHAAASLWSEEDLGRT